MRLSDFIKAGLPQFKRNATGGIYGLSMPGGSVTKFGGVGRKTVYLGDSITANGAGSGGTSSEVNGPTVNAARGWSWSGWQTWLMARLGQPWWTDLQGTGATGTGGPGGNQAISSQTSYDIVDRLSYLISAQPDVVIMHFGTNDVGNLGVSLTAAFPHRIAHTPSMAGLKANTITILNTACSIAKVVVMIGVLPRTNSATVTKRLQHLRQFQREVCRQYPNCIYVDPWEQIVNQSSTNGDVLPLLMQDQILHPSAKGAYLMSDVLTALLAPLFPPSGSSVATLTDVFDATENPYGNICTNATLAGTTGTFTGNTATLTGGSQLATSWNFSSSNTTNTITATKSTAVLNGVTYNVQELTVVSAGGGARTDSAKFKHADLFSGSGVWNPAGNFVVGDRFIAEMRVELLDTINATLLQLNIGCNDGVVANTRGRIFGLPLGSYTNADGIETLPDFTAATLALTLRTPILDTTGLITGSTNPGTATFASMIFNLTLGVNGLIAGSKIEVRIYPPIWRKLPPESVDFLA